MIYSLHWLKTLRLEGIKWWSGSRMALRWKVKLNWVEALLLDGGSAVFVVFKKAFT